MFYIIKQQPSFLEIPYILTWMPDGLYTSKRAFNAALHGMFLKQQSIISQPLVMWIP